MKLVLLVLISCTLIGSIELLKRKFFLPTSITRRIIHIGTASVVGVAPLFVNQSEIDLVSIIFAVGLLYARRHQIFSAIHSVERTTFGEVCLPLGVALAALFFLPDNLMAFQFGIFVMGISDPLAGIIGERFGKHHFVFFNNKKSLEGSLAFFASTIILALFFLPLGYNIILIAAALTLIEFLMVYGLDNLTLPIVGALLIQMVL